MRRNWTREESILAVNLYCKTVFGKIHQRNPAIIELAELINRSPSAVCWKMVNFAHLDPSLDRMGASHVSQMDRDVWQEYYQDWDKLVFESEFLLAEFRHVKLGSINEKNFVLDNIVGKEREQLVKARVNQNFFRKVILTSYNNKCAITGIDITKLLIASHIKPWAKDEKNRVNPRNGICLNALHDKAFDQGLITISKDYKVIISTKIINNSTIDKFILKFKGREINLPNRFLPQKEFLEYHNDMIFKG